MSEKTEEPTPRRLRRAQDDGDSPVSPFASQAVAFLCAVAVAPAAITALATRTTDELRAAIAHAGDHAVTVTFEPLSLATAVVALTAPILLAAAVGAAVTAVVQSGGIVSTRRLSPKLARLDVVTGLANLFATARLVAVLRAALFGGAVATFAYSALREHAGDLARTAGRLPEAAALAGILALDVVKRAAILGVFLAILDVVVTRRAWRKRLMMSRAEVKRELKETEGDPELASARERVRRELSTSATVADLARATVVVVDPVQIACALRYDGDDDDDDDDDDETAPVLIASGRAALAKPIVDAARAFGVPVLRDAPLARALVELEIGAAIPEALYESVAEIIRAAREETDASRQPTAHESP